MEWSDEEQTRYKKPAKRKTAAKGCPENDGNEHVYVNVGYTWRYFVCVCGHRPNHRTLARLLKEEK